MVNIVEGALRAIPVFGPIYSEIRRQIPRMEDEVTVEVVGQPGATKKQLYYLALSTAFGLIRRLDLGVARFFLDAPPGLLMVEYDAADHWVRATVKFNTGLASAAALTGVVSTALEYAQAIGVLTAEQIDAYMNNQEGVGAVAGVNLYAQAVVYSGPKDEVKGGPFNFTGVATPGLPSTSFSYGAPKLPFKGETILTTEGTINVAGQTIPTPNPKPPGDNRSRGAVVKRVSSGQASSPLDGTDGFQGSPPWLRQLIPLIFDCLTNPGSEDDQTFPPPNPGPLGG